MVSLSTPGTTFNTNGFLLFIFGSILFLLSSIVFLGLEPQKPNKAEIYFSGSILRVDFSLNQESEKLLKDILMRLKLPEDSIGGINLVLGESTKDRISPIFPKTVNLAIGGNIINWQTISNQKTKRPLWQNLKFVDHSMVAYIETLQTIHILGFLNPFPSAVFEWLDINFKDMPSQSLIISKNDTQFNYLFITDIGPDFKLDKQLQILKDKLAVNDKALKISQNVSLVEKNSIYNLTVESLQDSIQNYALAVIDNHFMFSTSEETIKNIITSFPKQDSPPALKVNSLKGSDNFGFMAIFLKKPEVLIANTDLFPKIKISPSVLSDFDISQIENIMVTGNQNLKGFIILK